MADKLGISLSELTGEPVVDLRQELNTTGKNLHTIGQQLTAPSRSKEWRLLSEGLETLEKQNKAAFQATYNFLITTYPEIFAERTDDDDPES